MPGKVLADNHRVGTGNPLASRLSGDFASYGYSNLTLAVCKLNGPRYCSSAFAPVTLNLNQAVPLG